MGDYASKGVAGAGLGTGIAGLSLGVLNAMGGCNGGLLGGLFGGNRYGYGALGLGESQYVASILAENGMLKAENYSDRVAKEVYQAPSAD